MAKRLRLISPDGVKLRPSHVKPGGCKFYRAGDEVVVDEAELALLKRRPIEFEEVAEPEEAPKKRATPRKRPSAKKVAPPEPTED
jgi:hypothetical protein